MIRNYACIAYGSPISASRCMPNQLPHCSIDFFRLKITRALIVFRSFHIFGLFIR